MTTERRTNHTARAAMLRLRLAEYRIADRLAFRWSDLSGQAAALESLMAIDGVVELLRRRGGLNMDQGASDNTHLTNRLR